MNTPVQGDIWSLYLPDTAGHEQRGRRPVLILSSALFNRTTGQALVCPITTADRGYPFHVALPEGLAVRGIAMIDQLRSMDWVERKAKFVCRTSHGLLNEALAILHAIIQDEEA